MMLELFIVQETIFEGGNVKFSKYLESFPFPYYVVLKNIEALPRTLADLLRQVSSVILFNLDDCNSFPSHFCNCVCFISQWFEIMQQQSRE